MRAAPARDVTAARERGPSWRSGVNALIGQRPGDETDDEIFAMLAELS